ncbi:MAG: DUF4139 domain-containing protein [Gemmataceae bacterium]
MRRTYLMVPCAIVLGLAAIIALLKPASSTAEAGKEDPPLVKAPSGPQLPITGCALFSSGVGYFQREGEVEGNARVDLTFPVQDINDLLKSMVLQDLGGGRIAAVSCDSRDPVDKTLKSFAVNLTHNPSYADILDQMRGEKVEVTLQQAANQPATLTGSVVGVEKQKQAGGKDGSVEIELLNLWCAEGLRNVKLPDVQRVRFLNPVMESEFRRALDVLALSHDTQKKAVSLTFEGPGKRPVRVGYVVENPIWKTSYRLVLNKDGKPYLQGWAVVENPTDEDWKDVHMALISGRPISFQMDLYQPLYVSRPTIVPELFASLQPRTYSGGMESERRALEKPAQGRSNDDVEETGKLYRKTSPKLDVERKKSGVQDKASNGPIAFRGFIDSDGSVSSSGVESVASATQLGDYFEYRIEHAVNLARQKSALLPIVTKDVEGTRVSIYNESTHAKFPLLGLKFKNTSGLHLMQGPLTVFDNANYAGDARIPDLQPGEERLLSYAVDLGTEVEATAKPGDGKLTKVKLQKGLLIQTQRQRETKAYKAKNRGDQDRTLIIEHPYRPAFKLVSEAKPAERARDVYRFELKLPANKTADLEVAEEVDITNSIQISNADDETMRFFLSQPVLSAKVKEALQKATVLKNKAATTQQELAQVNKELKTITEDQTRLRANLKETPATAPVYKRYLEKLEKQENEIDKLQASQKTLQDAELTQRREFEAYLAALDVE